MAASDLSASPLERHILLGDGWRILVRPLTLNDDGRIRDLLLHVGKEDLRLRFFNSIKEFTPAFIAGLTHLDYARAMAFVAIDEISNDTLGVVRLHADAAHETAEFAILLRSALKGRGLDWSLMQLIIEYTKSEGLKPVASTQGVTVQLDVPLESVGLRVRVSVVKREFGCHGRSLRDCCRPSLASMDADWEIWRSIIKCRHSWWAPFELPWTLKPGMLLR